MKYESELTFTAVLLLATLVLLIALSAVPGFEPLPWDMSHHYLGGQVIKEAMETSDAQHFRDSFVAQDLYPPGHSVALGLWLLIAGESVSAWIGFFILTIWSTVGALWWCSRSLRDRRGRLSFFVTSTALLLVTIRVLPLTATFMIDVPGTVISLCAVAALAGIRPPFRSSRTLLAWLCFSAALLTKYNIALPLVPAAGAFAILQFCRGRRREAALIVAVTAGALVMWALYLFLQTRGWESFLAFAENRANSIGWSPWRRLAWYLKDFAGDVYASWPVAAVVGGFALIGLGRWREPVVALTALYVFFTMAALARHPYLLDRNLVPVAAMMTIPFAAGVHWAWSRSPSRLRGQRKLTIGFCTVAMLGIMVFSIPRLREQTADHFQDAPRFAPLSEFVSDQFDSLATCRMVGTFTQFSGGWSKILWKRTKNVSDGLVLEFPYPLERSRERLDDRFSEAYAERLTVWLNGRPEKGVVAITLHEDSPFHSQGFQRWSGWKRHYVKALADVPGYELAASREFPELGVSVQVYRQEPMPVEFMDGWGPKQEWGRWAFDQQVSLMIIPEADQDCLRMRVATFPGMDRPQECRVLVAGQEVARFRVEGAPWQWQDHDVVLPPVTVAGARVDLEFSGTWPATGGGDRLRALAFQSISLVAVDH